MAALAAVSLGVLAACGGGGGNAQPEAAPNEVKVSEAPDYYPADYSTILEA